MRESLLADFALEWLLTSVDAHVNSQPSPLGETLVADFALECLLTSVHAHMICQSTGF